MGELWPGGPWELPLTIRVDGVPYELPQIEPPQLMSWLAHGSWWNLFPGLLLPDAYAALHERMYDKHDRLSYRHLFQVASGVLGRLAGMGVGSAGGGAAYWPAFRVAGTALAQWPVYAAWCATHHADPMAGPLWQQVALAYGWIRDENGDITKVEQQVWAPPPLRTLAAQAADPDDVPEHMLAEEHALAAQILAETLPGE